MDGPFKEGFYNHPQQGVIKIFQKDGNWVYVCYTRNGQKALSRERPLDTWVWALSEPRQ